MNNFDQEVMARTAIGEARGEGNTGMLAVMWTIMNRFTAKRWFSGQSLAGTALKFEQYDCWMPSDINYPLITNITSEIAVYNDAINMATQVMAGTQPDPTQGATHYYADSIDPPTWTTAATLTIQIGNHRFYKDVA